MKKRGIITIDDPLSHISECYKMCRTNIHYLHADDKCKVLVVTSSVPTEGKTTSVVNLAVTIAGSGKKVLVIDADLRKSTIHQVFEIDQSPGLINYLSDSKPLESVLKCHANIELLDILTSGVTPPNPAELLDSAKMRGLIEKVRSNYDYVLIDAPPILAVTDATILSQYADGIILIVASGKTKESDLERSVKHLKDLKIKILGSIITKAKLKKTKYNSYYGK